MILRQIDFHDSFIKTFAVTSRDVFENGVQSVTGAFDVRIDFALYKSRCNEKTIVELVTGEFQNAKDIVLDLRLPLGLFTSWNIDKLTIVSAEEDTRKDGAGFALEVERGFCVDNTSWICKKTRLFRFSVAEFHMGREGNSGK